ncbi:MAG: Cof-type HAD-IIB family hydrolase [Clostridia bacterium]|nr:Cof-type HAD-IIB family hydrolase [Clostridia bacterium]
MKYDVFLSDFDGTLVRGDGAVSEINKRAIARYRAAGGIFAIVTGRTLPSIRARLEELGIREGLVVAFQGATVADVATGKLLKDGGFDAASAIKAIRVLEAENVHIQIYTVNDFYCNCDDEGLKIYERVCGIKAQIIEDEPLSVFTERNGLRIVKILAMVEKEKREGLNERVCAALGGGFYVTRSAEYFVEILPEGETKGSAVDFLSLHYGVPRGKIAAIGDNYNDLPMLERAGGKFAVENAESPLKEIAEVVPSNEADGVAYALAFAMQ